MKKKKKSKFKDLYCLIGFVVALILLFNCYCEAEEKGEELRPYIEDATSIMSEVDATLRNIGLKLWPLEEGLKRVNASLERLKSLEYPEKLARQHKMVLLSFKKLRMGFLLFSGKDRDRASRLFRNGARLLKKAATDIVGIAKEEGLIRQRPSE